MKVAHSEPFSTTRDLVTFLNDNKIPREDVVQIITINGIIFLIYYK